MRFKSERIDSYPTMIFPDRNYIVDLASNGFYYDFDSRNLICYECQGIDGIHEFECFIPQLNRIINDYYVENDLKYRLISFRDGWKTNETFITSPVDLALIGLYYVGDSTLCCMYCDMYIRISSLIDISMADHRRLNPHCTFVK